LSQFAAEEAIVRAATNARDIELQARREEVMATLRALVPRSTKPLQPFLDQRLREAASDALYRIGFELGEIDEGIRQLERERMPEPRQ
jgi:hypothetical protein